MGWIVSREHHFIFVHIPKTAGSSIGDPSYKKVKKGSLIPFLGKEDEAYQGHKKAMEIKEHLKEPWEDFFKFCFVRNPWDRFVSAYTYYTQSISSVYSLFRFTQEHYKKHTTLGQQIAQCKTFREFCLNVDRFDLDLHFEPQADYVTDAEGNLLVDYIGRFENLDSDLNKICNRIGIPEIRLPHYRKTKRKHYKEYFDNETVDVVRRKYMHDIELFNYTF